MISSPDTFSIGIHQLLLVRRYSHTQFCQYQTLMTYLSLFTAFSQEMKRTGIAGASQTTGKENIFQQVGLMQFQQFNKRMSRYPITLQTFEKDVWTKKVNATLMMSFQVEDDTLPYLEEFVDILERVNTLPLSDTLEGEAVVMYFFEECFPSICQKLITSKHFKNNSVLTLSNRILELSANVYHKYLHFTVGYPKFAELLAIVFDPDVQYFKTNNQLEFKPYPWFYYGNTQDNPFLSDLKVGDIIDAIKYQNPTKKATWSRATIVEIAEDFITVRYLNDLRFSQKDIVNDSVQIAPLGTRCKDFEWRLSLKEGDTVDCCDSFGTWHSGTVVKTKNKQNGKVVKVGFKLFDPAGDRFQKGQPYFGLSESYDSDEIDVTTPEIQPLKTVARYKQYSFSKSHSDFVNDCNDHVMQEVNGKKIYVIPRSKFCSDTLFRTIRNFINQGGFEDMLQTLQEKINPDLLTNFLAPIGQIAPMLSKFYVEQLVNRIKPIIKKYLIDQSEAAIKSFTKDKSEAVFSAMKNLLKRIVSTQEAKQYQVSTKLEIANLCLKSQSLKRRLQGLSEVKDILKSVRTYLPHKVNTIGKWLKQHKVFEKIYVEDSHAQLIKKSTEYFKFLVSQNILEVDELQLIYKAAQRGDFETRISVYKLFEEVSNHFKKGHVDFLIDQILDSDIGLIATQDLDLLHQLQKYSNHFPLQKVVAFLYKILFSQTPNSQLLEVAIKRYSELVSKNSEMIKYREQNIKILTEKLMTDKVEIACKVITAILQNVGTGDLGRYEILQYINKSKIDSVVLETIRKNKESPKYIQLLQKLLQMISIAVQNSHRIKLNIDTFISFWEQLVKNSKNPREKQIYYKWCSAVSKVENVFVQDDNNKLEQFFLKLTSQEQISSLNQSSFDAISIMFLSINMKCHNIIQSHVWRSNKQEKTTRLLVSFSTLKFYDIFLRLIYNVDDEKVGEMALDFYCSLYANQELTSTDRQNYAKNISEDFFKFYQQKQYNKIPRVLKILNLVIDESEKGGPVPLKSLAMFKKGEKVTIDILNESAYLSDTNKSFQIKTDANITLLELKKLIAKQMSATWQELKLHQKQEITDIFNGRLIKDCPIKWNQSIKVSKRHTLQPQEDLLINNKLSPKAVKAFESIFNRFSSEGRMSKDDCQKFTAVCLGEATVRTYDDRISTVYEKYDDDKDNFLTLQNFLNFYEDASRQRPSTVWGNLKNCRIRYDLKSMDDPDSDSLDFQILPKYILSLNNSFYEALFDLLRLEDKIAKPSWRMLQRMPVSTQLYNSLLNSTNYEILNIQNPYKTLYCLYIFEHLLENQHHQQKQKQWREKFVREEGYQKLFNLYSKLFQNNQIVQVQIQISQFILDLISEFIVTVFKTSYSIKAYEILKSNIDFDDLVAYISTKTIPTDKNKAVKFVNIVNGEDNYEKFKNHEWKGVGEKEMTRYMIESIKKLWKQKDNAKTRDKMLEDCLSILLSLMLYHKDCSEFLAIVPELISTSQSHNLLVKLYLLLVCFCFYGKIDQQPVINTLLNFLKYFNTQNQNKNEKETSKKEGKSTFISEEYFRILVVLIENFGLIDMSPETIDILLRNVTESSNEQIIQASALVLSKLKLQNASNNILKQIWEKCLFSSNISSKKPETRSAVYKLVLSLGTYNKQFTNQLTNLISGTLNPCINQLKSMSELQLKSRCLFNYAGLRNLGAVCYMLAMLQQLYMNPTFRYLILRVDDKKPANLAIHNNREYDDNILHQIQNLFAFLQKTDRGDYNPVDFCYSFKDFEGNPVNVCIQQDTQEFVFLLLDRLQSALNPTPFKHIISNMYKGKSANIFTCFKCNNTKVREQDFFCLTLEVKNSKNLSESFTKFTNGEIINEYTCDFCQQKADVSKKTMVSKLPRVLFIHLQRIVFSLDTFVNQKISTKLEFPFEIDMTPYIFQPVPNPQEDVKKEQDMAPQLVQTPKKANEVEDNQSQSASTAKKENEESAQKEDKQNIEQNLNVNKNMYDLVGVVAHNGGAQYGHYYSYIKNENDQWLDFNDSNVKLFDLKNLEQQWFGGTTEAIEEQFDWTVKKQNSRSAYLLIYEQREKAPIDLVYTDTKQKQNMLSEYKLVEQTKQSSIAVITEQDTKLEDEQAPTISSRKFSKEEIIKDEQKKDIPEQTLNIAEPIIPYISEIISNKIKEDNLLHQFEVNICSTPFIKFYTQFLSLQIPKDKLFDVIQLTLKLALGIWLKQPALKELLPALEKAIQKEPDAGEIIISNQTVINLLLESSDSDIRSCMESLIQTAVGGLIQKNNLTLTKTGQLDTKLVNFLDNLFSLIPTTVSKNWMKFNQYFGVWKGLSLQGTVQTNYMLDKQMISHFLDYFLDKKSPLQIYSKKKYEIGNKSSSINPNFTSLLDTVSILVGVGMASTPMRLTTNDNKILMSFEFLDKMFSENSTFGSNLVIAMCTGNIAASQKVGIVLIKGIFRTTYENIQPFLDVAQSYLLIKDDFQLHRMKWVLGSPRLLISPLDKSISCMNTHSFDERLYNYDSTIQFDQTQSMLEGLYKNITRMMNYCMMILKCVLTMCSQDEFIQNYVWSLPPPVLTFAHYHDFFEGYMDSYIKQGIKLVHNTFPRVELGNAGLELYNKIVQKQKSQQQKETEKVEEKEEQTKIQKEEQKEEEKEEKEEEKAEQITEIQNKQEQNSCSSAKGHDDNLSVNKDDPNYEWESDYLPPNMEDMQNYLAYQGENYGSNEFNEETAYEETGVRLHEININDRVEQPRVEEIEASYDTDPPSLVNTESERSDNPPVRNTSEEPAPVSVETHQQTNETEKKQEVVEDMNATYHPVHLQYNELESEVVRGLKISHHNSELVFIKTYPSLKKNDLFLNINRKLIDRIPKQSFQTAITRPYHGILIQNTSKQSFRFQWKYGTGYLRGGDSTFVDTDKILKVWNYEKEEWPKWSMY